MKTMIIEETPRLAEIAVIIKFLVDELHIQKEDNDIPDEVKKYFK